MNTYQNYIAGADLAAADGRTFTAFNPTTGGVWGTFALAGTAEVDRAVKAAAAAFRGPWGALSPTRRGRLLMKWGESIAANADRIAAIETGQNGKLFAEMRAQARIAEDWLYYFGGLADKIEGTVIPLDRQTIFNYTLREPLGVVGVITPWNSPTFIAVMSLAPALAAGNTIVLKPSEITSASSIELARLAEEAGIPPGVVNVVTGFRETGEALVDHPQVAKVSFTGSVGAGRAIAARAGQRLVSCMLELGGKSPNIVFERREPGSGGGGGAGRHLRGGGADLRRRIARLHPAADLRHARRSPGAAREADHARRSDARRDADGAGRDEDAARERRVDGAARGQRGRGASSAAARGRSSRSFPTAISTSRRSCTRRRRTAS